MSRNASLVARTVSHLTTAAAESGAMAWAENLAKEFESLLTAAEANEAALLSAIGMAKHERIVNLRKRILEGEGSKGVETLRSLEERLKKELFVSPGSQEPTAADAILAWSAREVVDFVLEPSDRFYEYPSSNRWLEACLNHDAFKKALNEELVHMEVLDCDAPSRIVRGQTRDGVMIDAKPRSTDARRAADKVKALNAGYKKQMTQRQKEKAAVEVTTPEAQAALVPEFSLGEKIASSDPEKISKCIAMVQKAVNVDNLEKVEHAPAMDANNLSEALANKPGIKCKNLFLKCKKPRNETDSGLQLVCCPVDRQVDLKLIQTQLGYKDQLRFAAADVLEKHLDVTQGNVTPFALVNDPQRVINIVLDDEMMKNPDTLLWFHPLDNTASVGIPAGKLLEFIKVSGRVPMILPLTPQAAAAAGPAAAGNAAPAAGKKEAAPSSAKKSSAKGGEGAPLPTKKSAPAPISTDAAVSSPKRTAATSSSFQSPPQTVEEALEREEKALALVQERAAHLEQARATLEKAKATGVAADVEAAEKAVKTATRAKKEADMVYGNAAGFTEKLRHTSSSPAKASADAGAAPLSFTLTHELAQDRLWARLDKMLSGPPKRLEGVEQAADAVRPAGHSTHNLMVKDSKTKKLYLICLRQDRQIDLKTIGEKIGAGGLRLAGAADVETAIALTRGCITPMSLYNNVQGTVTPVFDAALMAEPDKKLTICAGCDDAHNHPAHNCVDISVNQMLELINEAAKREHVVLPLDA